MATGERLTSAGLENFDRIAAGHVGDDGVPGLVALLARGEEVHVTALGSLTIDGPPVRRDSIFRIASMSKPIAAAAALALIDEGLLALNEPVGRLLPELAEPQVLRQMSGSLDDTVPAERPITVRDVLTFTFGFGLVNEIFAAPEPWPVVTAANALGLGTLGSPAPDVPPDQDAWIAGLGSLPLLAQPGERWLYNTPASVLGVLLSRAAGAPLQEVVSSRLFGPLGMTDTAFHTTATDRLATAYQGSADGLVAFDDPDGVWSRPQPFADAAAGLVSTADDLLAFARMLLGGGAPVLTSDAVAAMTSDQLTPAQKSHGGMGPDFFATKSWGYGVAVMDSGAYGWAGGLGTTWLSDPRHDLVVIVLTQKMFESASAPTVHVELQAAAYAALGRSE